MFFSLLGICLFAVILRDNFNACRGRRFRRARGKGRRRRQNCEDCAREISAFKYLPRDFRPPAITVSPSPCARVISIPLLSLLLSLFRYDIRVRTYAPATTAYPSYNIKTRDFRPGHAV